MKCWKQAFQKAITSHMGDIRLMHKGHSNSDPSWQKKEPAQPGCLS